MAKWLERLEDYERQEFREVPGKASNPKILKWAHGVGQADYMTDDSTTPWCGIGLAGVMEECGLADVIPPGPAAAINWLKCGVPCEPKPGAIAVFPRTGGNHVTVIKRVRGDVWDCIGCNQSNSICTTEFRASEARGTRWPIKPKTPAELAAGESRIAAAAARQQTDAAKGTGVGSTTQVPIPAPPKASVQQTIDNMFSDVSWAKQTANNLLDFAGFLGERWPWVAGAIALYFGARMLWDSHLIKTWRTQDHNEGFTT